MSCPVSTPLCGEPLVSITACVRQKVSIACATKPCDQTLRAFSICATRSEPALSASFSTRV
jgi:hypothetical protein